MIVDICSNRIDKFVRICSSVAECPCDVNSMIISQSASGNGVNCPCAVGARMQSSMSPVINNVRYCNLFISFTISQVK